MTKYGFLHFAIFIQSRVSLCLCDTNEFIALQYYNVKHLRDCEFTLRKIKAPLHFNDVTPFQYNLSRFFL